MFLGARARATTVEAVLRDLRAGAVDTRARAAEESVRVAEGDLAAREAIVDALMRALTDEGDEVRAAAATALADLRAQEALAALTIAADDEAPLVRQLAISALGEIGDPRARERVRRALSDDRPEVRFQAIVAFPRLVRDGSADDRADAWEALHGGLCDADEHVRERAAEACGELAEGDALPRKIGDRLARLTEDAEHPRAGRVAAAIALAESGDQRGAKVLLDLVRRRLPEAEAGRAQAAFELLGELQVEEVRALAATAAFGVRGWFGDPGVKSAALVALVRLGDRRAIEQVLSDLSARSWSRRMGALGVTMRAELTAALPTLRAMRERPEGVDPEMIDEAIARLTDAK